MSELKCLKNIFTDKLFRIPIYQRGYAWTLPQLTDFWEDINNLPLIEEREHYTGLLSIKKINKEVWKDWNDENWLLSENTITPYYIVDGQQRLTTFIIAIFVICNFIKSLEENKEKKDIRDIYIGAESLYDIERLYLYIKKPPTFAITTYKFGYEKDNPSFEYFIDKTLERDVNSEVTETYYTLNLENTKKFFENNIRNLYSDQGLKAIEDLFTKLTKRLVFDISEIKDNFNEYVAFETINNRGKKLSNLELLKNRLIYLVSLYTDKECPQNDKIKIVENINDAWKTIYENLGKNKNMPLNDDEFLMNHWIMYFKYNRKKGEAYRDFLLKEHFIVQNVYDKVKIDVDNIESVEETVENVDYEDEIDDENEGIEEVLVAKLKPTDISEYVLSIKNTAPFWYKIKNPQFIENKEEGKWIEKLNRLGIMYFRPIIVASYLNPLITSEQRIELLKRIERYIFVVFRTTGALSTLGNSKFYTLCNELYRDSKTLDIIIEALDDSMKGWVIDDNGFYKIDSFKAKLDKLFTKNEGYYSWNGLRYLLYEYELKCMENRSITPKIEWELFKRSDKDRVSIEHIFPQTPNDKYWIDRFGKFDEKQKKILTNTLGNLLALSSGINSSLQNDSFDSKKEPKIVENKKIREGYSNGSYQEIEVSQEKEWTSEEILNRGKKLIDFMSERWSIKFKDENDKKTILYLNEIL